MCGVYCCLCVGLQSGKSYLSNMLLGRQVFKSNFSAGSVTNTTSFEPLDGHGKWHISDIPGLIEGQQSLIDRNKREIDRAFKQHPVAVVLFVFSAASSGRLLDQDVIAWNALHKAYRFDPESVLFIVNNVDAEEVQESETQAMEEAEAKAQEAAKAKAKAKPGTKAEDHYVKPEVLPYEATFIELLKGGTRGYQAANCPHFIYKFKWSDEDTRLQNQIELTNLIQQRRCSLHKKHADIQHVSASEREANTSNYAVEPVPAEAHTNIAQCVLMLTPLCVVKNERGAWRTFIRIDFIPSLTYTYTLHFLLHP